MEGIFFVVGIILVGLVFKSYGEHRLNTCWAEAAHSLGMHFAAEGHQRVSRSLTGQLGGCWYSLSQKPDDIGATVLVRFARELDFDLTITKETFLDTLEYLCTGKDIQLGKKEVDSLVKIMSSDEERAQKLLSTSDSFRTLQILFQTFPNTVITSDGIEIRISSNVVKNGRLYTPPKYAKAIIDILKVGHSKQDNEHVLQSTQSLRTRLDKLSAQPSVETIAKHAKELLNELDTQSTNLLSLIAERFSPDELTHHRILTSASDLKRAVENNLFRVASILNNIILAGNSKWMRDRGKTTDGKSRARLISRQKKNAERILSECDQAITMLISLAARIVEIPKLNEHPGQQVKLLQTEFEDLEKIAEKISLMQ